MMIEMICLAALLLMMVLHVCLIGAMLVLIGHMVRMLDLQLTASGGGIPTRKPKPRRKSAKERAKDKEQERRMQAEEQRVNTILENIEAYDGTGIGQKEV